MIKAEEIIPEQVTAAQMAIDLTPEETHEEAYSFTRIERSEQTDAVISKAHTLIQQEVSRQIQTAPNHTVTKTAAQKIVETVATAIAEDQDLGDTFHENEMPLTAWMAP